ncbi:PTS system transporter subunit IIC [Streptococcus pneumoniae]|nr:PTS system transporter subunit IIC [Streptococcus pneumoniae]
MTVAGKMLPAIGFAMILSVMAKKELIPFVLLGYVCAAYLNIPTIGIAIVGTIFALIEFYNKPKTANHVVEEEAHDDWI